MVLSQKAPFAHFNIMPDIGQLLYLPLFLETSKEASVHIHQETFKCKQSKVQVESVCDIKVYFTKCFITASVRRMMEETIIRDLEQVDRRLFVFIHPDIISVIQDHEDLFIITSQGLQSLEDILHREGGISASGYILMIILMHLLLFKLRLEPLVVVSRYQSVILEGLGHGALQIFGDRADDVFDYLLD